MAICNDCTAEFMIKCFMLWYAIYEWDITDDVLNATIDSMFNQGIHAIGIQ